MLVDQECEWRYIMSMSAGQQSVQPECFEIVSALKRPVVVEMGSSASCRGYTVNFSGSGSSKLYSKHAINPDSSLRGDACIHGIRSPSEAMAAADTKEARE